MAATSPRGPADPGRRDRIVEATLEVIAAAGVAGASHRRIAAAAGVPLGSMTYYFTGIEQVLREAFTRYADRAADAFDAALDRATTPAEALDVVAETILRSGPDHGGDAVVAYELYTLAAREPAFRDITERWMARSRAALERHLDPLTARLLDALIEGLSVHRTLDRDPVDAADAAEAVRRLARG
ncbi:MAG: TetR family transcriptional regulator [Salana multivorans]|uniref:TetR/AcrR family transcriptional regulator n=1 Tax=Salana multivorans TaxID=120377 RepID=UPI00095B6863|nr:TetR family transcriptional regulator [Salana multivorans]MBN8881851.1 TetR family transcriptional regulator [Salana multivorans]OJX95357.1 MAG: TetR family transcriptional regulator [Micrococcales bacterium 73-15]